MLKLSEKKRKWQILIGAHLGERTKSYIVYIQTFIKVQICSNKNGLDSKIWKETKYQDFSNK